MKISASKVKCYKACKRAYYFRYVEELVPVETAQPLVDGSNYHSMLEQLYKEGWYQADVENNPKIAAMAAVYEKYIYPKLQAENQTEIIIKIGGIKHVSKFGRTYKEQRTLHGATVLRARCGQEYGNRTYRREKRR